MSKQDSIYSKQLSSPLGKSLQDAFSKTISKMEARIIEKSQPAVSIDNSNAILKAYKVQLDSHITPIDATTKIAQANKDSSKVQAQLQARNESAFISEHRRICRRPPFHMLFTDSLSEEHELSEPATKPSSKERDASLAGGELGNFNDSDLSSDDEELISLGSKHDQASRYASEHMDTFPTLIPASRMPSLDIATSRSSHDIDSQSVKSRNDEVLSIQSDAHISLQQSSVSVSESISMPKLASGGSNKLKNMKFHTDDRQYALGMIGAPHLSSTDRITSRRYYISSCEKQKITPYASHISRKSSESNANVGLQTISDRTINIKGLGEKRLLALSQFIQDRLNEDGSHLILRDCSIGNEGCKILQQLAGNSKMPCKLQLLDLSENCFSAAGIRLLSPLLVLPSLSKLVLSCINMGDSGICTLVEILCENSHIDPESSSEGTKAVFKTSVRTQNLAFLDLSHNLIRAKGASSIARIISASISLVHLELGWNAIGAVGCSAIEKSLQKNDKIIFLGLSWNGLDEIGGITISSLIATSKFIKHLDISHNRITTLATCLIASALRQNSCLAFLNLSGNLIGKFGCRALYRVLRWQQCHRRAKYLEQVDSDIKFAEYSLNLDASTSAPAVQSFATLIDINSCVFDDKDQLDIGLHNCNGAHKLNMKSILERAKFAELYVLDFVEFWFVLLIVFRMELAYVGEPLPMPWSNCSLDGRNFRPSTVPSCHSMPPSSGIFEGYFQLSFRPCDAPNCIDSESFSVIIDSIKSSKHASINSRLSITMSHFSEFVFFSSQQIYEIISCFEEPAAHLKIILSLYCKIVDVQKKPLFISILSKETRCSIMQKLGQLFDFCTEFPMRHYRIDLSKRFDVDLFQKIQSANTIQRRLAAAIRLPDTSQYSLLPMCIRNVYFNGILQKDFSVAYSLPSVGIIELDFTSILSQIKDAHGLSPCSDRLFMEIRQQVYKAIANSSSGLDVLASKLQSDGYSITTKQTFFLLSLWPPFLVTQDSSLSMESLQNITFPRLEALVLCFPHISDLENLWPMLRCDSDYSWHSIQLICRRIGWLNVWNPVDADGYYELDLAIRDEKIVAECLVVLSVKEPGENWQDETFNGQRFELPVTWVTAVPERGIVTLTYTSGSKKRNMLIEIRKQLANKCLVRYCINKLPKDEAEMIAEERRMQEMTEDAAAAALAQGYADLAEDDESKELQELILVHSDAILLQDEVVASIQKEMELRMMDDVQKYIELKKRLAVEIEVLEKQKTEVNIIIESAKKKLSAESLESVGIEMQEVAEIAAEEAQ